MIDSGVDLNCIQEGLISIVYFVKTSQKLSTASNVPLKVQYNTKTSQKLSTASNVPFKWYTRRINFYCIFCKYGICIKTSFLLVKNINHQIVLGTHFLTQLYYFHIDSQGLQTNYKNQQILFEFIKGVEIKEINQLQDHINLLQQKHKQVKIS